MSNSFYRPSIGEQVVMTYPGGNAYLGRVICPSTGTTISVHAPDGHLDYYEVWVEAVLNITNARVAIKTIPKMLRISVDKLGPLTGDVMAKALVREDLC